MGFNKMPMHSTAAVVSIVLVCALASCSAEQAPEGDGLALMESLGLRAEQEDVDKSVWEARQAKEAEEAEAKKLPVSWQSSRGLTRKKQRQKLKRHRKISRPSKPQRRNSRRLLTKNLRQHGQRLMPRRRRLKRPP